MTQSLSIIIAARNSHATLPHLLWSISRQKLDIQVIVVDDYSQEPYDVIVNEWQCKGMHIELIRTPHLVQTKDARLIGLERAIAPVITFADADDAYYGSENLARAVTIYHETGADLLQFAAVTSETPQAHFLNWALPFVDRLEGWDIIRTFGERFTNWEIWCRLYSRDLWLKLMPIARAFPLGRYCDDLYLFLLYALHAKLYIGTLIPAYSYYYVQAQYSRALGRMLATETVRRLFPDYMRQCHCPEEICTMVETGLARHVTLQATRYVETRASIKDPNPQARFADALEIVTPRELLQILMQANGRLAQEIKSRLNPISRLVCW